MSTIVVVGHVNHDRIWRLDRPLQPGSRLSCLDRAVRLGGGARYTGSLLLEQGHEVVLVTGLADDERGRTALSQLQAEGFVTDHVAMVAGETVLTEILVGSDGERTIIAGAGRQRPFIPSPLGLKADAAYINTFHVSPELIAGLQAMPLVVSQYPLQQVGPRSVDVIIGSCADLGHAPVPAIWREASRMSAPRLQCLVLTDGAHPVRIFDGKREQMVPVPDRVASPDTTGAGDYFAAGYLDGMLMGLDAPAAAEHASRITARKLRERSSAQWSDPLQPA